MLFLKHYGETGEKLLELTCTQQLQKWHKRCKKGSIPMLPLAQLKVKAAKLRKARGAGGVSRIVAADPEAAKSRRSIPNQIKTTEALIRKNGLPVMDHFYSVLSASSIGRKSSFGEHICFMYAQKAMEHHDYAMPETHADAAPQVVAKPTLNLHPHPTVHSDTFSHSDIITQDEIPIKMLRLDSGMYDTDESRDFQKIITEKLKENKLTIEIDLRDKLAPVPRGANYVNCSQRTDVWHALRKFKVTGSRLPALLGFYGREKLIKCLGVVRDDDPEKDLSGIQNIQRGIFYENEGVQYFERQSGSTAGQVGFFIHPNVPNFGASPDAVCASGILLEVKTRGKVQMAKFDAVTSFSTT